MRQIKKVIGIIIVVAVVLAILPFLILGYMFIPKVRIWVLKKYAKMELQSMKYIKHYLTKYGELDSIVDGVPVYIVDKEMSDPVMKQTGGAFYFRGVGIAISREFLETPWFKPVFYHELCHAKNRHKANRGLLRTIKQEIEADRFSASLGYKKELIQLLVEKFKEKPIGYLVPFMLVHIWRILALLMYKEKNA